MSATRSSMFFVSDVRSAAETAAYAIEEHGLDPDACDELADELEESIGKFVREYREARGV